MTILGSETDIDNLVEKVLAVSENRPSYASQKKLLKGKKFRVLEMIASDTNEVWGVAQTPHGAFRFTITEEHAPLFAPLQTFPQIRKVMRDEFHRKDISLQTRLNGLGIKKATFKTLTKYQWRAEVEPITLPINGAAYKEFTARIPPVSFDPVHLIEAHETSEYLKLAEEPCEKGAENVASLLSTIEFIYKTKYSRVGIDGKLAEKYAEGMAAFGDYVGIKQRRSGKEILSVQKEGSALVNVYFDEEKVIAGMMMFAKPLSSQNIGSPGTYLIDVFVNPQYVNPEEGTRAMFNIAYLGLIAQGKQVKALYTHGLSDSHETWLKREAGFTKKLPYKSTKCSLLSCAL